MRTTKLGVNLYRSSSTPYVYYLSRVIWLPGVFGMEDSASWRVGIVAFFAIVAVSAATMLWLFWRFPLMTAIVTLGVLAILGVLAKLARSVDVDIQDLDRTEQGV
jgi:hypothetical protein